jgi:hypothetical protein
VLHPRVRDQDEVARQPGTEHRDPERGEVQPGRKPIPAEDPEPEERRLEHECRQPFDRQRRAEDVADELRIDGPVHPELELLHEPGRDPDREVDQEQRSEEAGQPEPGLVARPVPERLHGRHEGPKPERQRHEEEVVDRGRGELDPREIHGRRRDRAHLADGRKRPTPEHRPMGMKIPPRRSANLPRMQLTRRRRHRRNTVAKVAGAFWFARIMWRGLRY